MNFLWPIRNESYKKGLLLSVVFNIIAKAILFILTICIAGLFGSNIKTDIYFFVFGSMVLLSGFINNIDTMVLIPESMRLREKEGDIVAMAFLNYFFRLYILAGIVFIAGIFLLGTKLLGYVSRFSATDIITYKNYFLIGSFYFLFLVLTNYINNILTSLKFFTIPMIISGFNSFMVIAGIFLLHRKYDMESVFISGVAAYLLNLVILVLVMKKIVHWNFYTRAAGIRKKLWNNIAWTEAGQMVTLAGSFFPLFLLSGFGKGVISVMNYGKNIADIPNTIFTAQLASVSGIKLNEQFARNDRSGMNENFLKIAKLLVFILVPASCFMWVFAVPVVELFYKHGNFNDSSVLEAARFLQLLSLTIFSVGVNAIVTRLFIATQSIRQAFLYQVGMNLFLIGAIWVFSEFYGAYGYPYGTITMNILNYFMMYFICRKLSIPVTYSPLFKYTLIIILVNTMIAAILYFISPFIRISTAINLICFFILYLTVLLGINKKFKLNKELRQATRLLGNYFNSSAA